MPEILDLKRCNVKDADVVKFFASRSISLDIYASENARQESGDQDTGKFLILITLSG